MRFVQVAGRRRRARAGRAFAEGTVARGAGARHGAAVLRAGALRPVGPGKARLRPGPGADPQDAVPDRVDRATGRRRRDRASATAGRRTPAVPGGTVRGTD